MNKKVLLFAMVAIVSTLAVGFNVSNVQASSYTNQQVLAHSSKGDCWMVINGKVYNLTSFIGEHPGGASAIIAQCGKDGTSSFNNGPHSASSLNAIKSYIIGDFSAGATVTTSATPVPTNTQITPANPQASTQIKQTTSARKGSLDSDDDSYEENENEDEDEDDEFEDGSQDDRKGGSHRDSNDEDED